MKPFSDFARPPPAGSPLLAGLKCSPAPRSGDASVLIGSHDAGYDAIRPLPIFPPAHSRCSFAIGSMPACYETGDGATDETRNPDEKRDERRDEGGTGK